MSEFVQNLSEGHNQDDFLKSLVGRPYRDFDAEGNYLGCFEPLYLLYPDLPKYPLPKSSKAYFSLGTQRIFENFEQVEMPKTLDMILFCFRKDMLHVGIYVEGRKFLHVQRGSAFEIQRLALYENKILGYYKPKSCLTRKLETQL